MNASMISVSFIYQNGPIGCYKHPISPKHKQHFEDVVMSDREVTTIPLTFPPEGARLIPLRNRKGEAVAHAIVDAEDYEWLSQWAWHVAAGSGYAARCTGNRETFYMHRVIAGTPDGLQTDHKNGDGLDNRRSNLRVCTNAENQHNTAGQRNSTSRFCGVSWHSGRSKWMAQIACNGKNIYLGSFTDETEAARAYNEAARRLHGVYARLNQLDG